MLLSNNGRVKILVRILMQRRNRIIIAHPEISGIWWRIIEKVMGDMVIEILWNLLMEMLKLLLFSQVTVLMLNVGN